MAGTSTRPRRANAQRITPVSTSTVPAVSVTRSGVSGAAAVPGRSTYSSAGGTLVPIACAVHFTLPSGQNPMGQDCTGTAAPAAVARDSSWPRATAPRGQGTPQVVPASAAGAPPSSQRSGAATSAAGTVSAATRVGAAAAGRDSGSWDAAPAIAAPISRLRRGSSGMAPPRRERGKRLP
jgi:hypothetical protein